MSRPDAIVLWWIGADMADDALLERTARGITRELQIPVVRHRDGARPDHTFDASRGQHSSTGILRWLAERMPARARKVVALTDVDLFIPVLTFVYGEAVLNGTAAVVSTARLGTSEPGQFEPRLLKTCVHEVGHTFGLVHCDAPRCVMRRSTNLGGLDLKLASFCGDCRVRYRESLTFQETAS
jgi:archaemetzincin